MSGLPYGGPSPAPGGGRKLLVLALVAGLLLLVSGVMTTLYIGTAGDLERAEKVASERAAKIEVNGKEIDSLKRDLEQANDKLKATEQDLTGTQNARDEQQRQKEVIGKCLDLLTKALTAKSKAEFDKLAKEGEKVCDEAEKYV
ncbi:hypothetical protein GCM10027605_21310 [Micromonospora zhanjiangensis]